MSISNTKTSKKELAYIQIKNSIMNNEFTSDNSLTEAFLCERFGFSRTPVREALQRLASEEIGRASCRERVSSPV